ncbi:MAG: Uma2 family endonuclease [Thiolinea sp.]
MQALQQHLTREEYLALDEASPEKHQFYRGEIFAMSGGSFSHAAIAGNVYSALRNVGHSCQPMNSDMRVSTPSGLDTYPDVSVYCGEPELADQEHTLLNPVLIVEVLSPSTRGYDRGDKFGHYRSIPVLQDYVLIDSEALHVEHFQRQGEAQWLLSEYWQPEDVLQLAGVQLHITLQDIYRGSRLLAAG